MGTGLAAVLYQRVQGMGLGQCNLCIVWQVEVVDGEDDGG